GRPAGATPRCAARPAGRPAARRPATAARPPAGPPARRPRRRRTDRAGAPARPGPAAPARAAGPRSAGPGSHLRRGVGHLTQLDAAGVLHDPAADLDGAGLAGHVEQPVADERLARLSVAD